MCPSGGEPKANIHPLLDKQWSIDEFTLLKALLALIGAATSVVAMVFFGGYAFILGGVAVLLLLVGGILMGLATTDRSLTQALRLMLTGAVLGFGPAFYVVI